MATAAEGYKITVVTEFEVLDAVGKVLATGEIDNGIYRVFMDADSSHCEEYKEVSEVLKACGGVGLQPKMFPTRPRTRQLSLLGGMKD